MALRSVNSNIADSLKIRFANGIRSHLNHLLTPQTAGVCGCCK